MTAPEWGAKARPTPSYEIRQDAEAAVAARRELGPEYEDHLAAGLAERVEQLADARLAELRRDGMSVRQGSALEATLVRNRFVLGIISLGAGIPITAIAGGLGDLPGIFLAWAGIVGVNVAHALGNRPRRPRD